MPQYAAGRITDPCVCVPSASGTISAATAAAEPLDEPPGVNASFHGLTVAPGLRHANSVVTVLPIIDAPAARKRATTHASRSGRRPLKTSQINSVGMTAVSITTFTATGT